MKRSASHLICRALLFVFITSAKATPLLHLPSSGQLSLLNISNSSPTHPDLTVSHSLTIGSDFPPGPEPPGKYLYYRDPSSHHPVIVKFVWWEPQPIRDKKVVDTCFEEAIFELSDSTKRSMRTGELEWVIGHTTLALIPVEQLGNGISIDTLNYEMAANALIDVNKFRLAYPILNFAFFIYYTPGNATEPLFAGDGYLEVTSDGAPGRVSNLEIGSAHGVDAA